MSSTAGRQTASEPARAVVGAGLWLAWIALAATWLVTVGRYPLFEPDEARYAEIPREMVASGDWVTPRLNDLKYFEKPPLQYWATATLYAAFGVSDWTARAWAVGTSFLCLALVFLWARKLYGDAAAAGALAVLGTSPLFIVMGHVNVLDGAFTLWLTSTLFSFTIAQTRTPGSGSERNWMLLCWGMAALAVLSKGIVVAALLGLTLIIYSFSMRDFGSWRRLHLLAGIPLFLAMAMPWFVVVSLRNPEFPGFFFLHEHFARFLTTVHRRTEPWWYFLPLMALALLPWSLQLWRSCRGAWQAVETRFAFRPLRFLLIYGAVVVVFFSLSQSKLPPYILPAIPAFAAIIGVQVAYERRAVQRAAWISLVLVSIAAAGLVIHLLNRNPGTSHQSVAWAAAAVGAAMAGLGITRYRRSALRDAFLTAGCALLAWQCLLVTYANPPTAPRSARNLAEALRPMLHSDTPIYSVGQYRQSIPFYLQRKVTLVDYQGELAMGQELEPGRSSASLPHFTRAWTQSADAFALFEPSRWAAMSGAGLPGRVIAIDRRTVLVSRR